MANLSGKGGAKKGEVRNPNGRPKKDFNLMQACRENAPKAVEQLLKIAFKSKHEKNRLEAIKILLERGYGKAPQPLTGDEGQGPVQIQVITGVPRAPKDPL